MSTPTAPESFHQACRQLGVPCPESTTKVLSAYVQRLVEANQAFNLTAVTDVEEVWHRHLVDSLTLYPLVPSGAKVADVGSGGGLPGIPLAITHPGIGITLIEATRKKADFLSETVDALGLKNVSVCNQRAEDAGQDPAYRETFDLVTGRALSGLPVFLELTVPLARVGGTVLAMKGSKVNEELKSATRAFEELGCKLIDRHRPATVDNSCILIIEKTNPTKAIYPRRPGTPKKRPL